MTYFDMQGPIRKTLPAIIAGVALFLAAVISVSGINVLGYYFGFGFIPLIVIYLWPRLANTLLSLLIIFMAGIFTDWGTDGIIGQWSLVFCATWGFLRPELRNDPFAPLRLLSIWFATCGLALVLVSLSGFFVYGILPDIASIGRQIICATICLPLVILFRHLVSKRMSEADPWKT